VKRIVDYDWLISCGTTCDLIFIFVPNIFFIVRKTLQSMLVHYHLATQKSTDQKKKKKKIIWQHWANI